MKLTFSSVMLRIKNYGVSFLKLCGVVLTMAIIFWIGRWISINILPNDWSFRYTVQYSVDRKHVTIAPKPHDCEWGAAPLGDKHCRYEAIVGVFNSENQLVGGTSIKLGKSTTGKPIISFDGGKTWELNPANNNLRAVSVTVLWQKIED